MDSGLGRIGSVTEPSLKRIGAEREGWCGGEVGWG